MVEVEIPMLPGRVPDLSEDAPQAPEPNIQKIAPEPGEKVAVAGVAGWYGENAAPEGGTKGNIGGKGGDTFFTTSADGYKVNGIDPDTFTGVGIAATATETACQRARREGGIDFETKLVPLVRSDGGPLARAMYAVVRKPRYPGDPKANTSLGDIGRVAACRGKAEDHSLVLDPAPTMLQPSALDTLDALCGKDFGGQAFEVDRGGLIGGSVPWIQARPITIEMPNGDTLEVRPMVTNPLDGTGAFAFCLAGEALSCRNIYTSLLGSRKGVFRLKHCASSEMRLKQLEKGLRLVSESLPERLGVMRMMASHRISQDWLEKAFLPKVLKYDPEVRIADLPGKTRNKAERVLEHYANAKGAAPGTGWGALQAVTFTTTHDWSGSKGDTIGANDTQFWSGSAGMFEARAVGALFDTVWEKAPKARRLHVKRLLGV